MTAPHSILTVIPARLESQRLPRKLLKTIHGKPVIFWTANRVRLYGGTDFLVATDSREIADVCEEFDLPFSMTSPACQNGTERVFEIAKKFPQYSHFLNIQGDEPLVDVGVIDTMLKDVGVSDHAFKVSLSKVIEQDNNPSEIKVAMQENRRIRYASRARVPHDRDSKSHTFKINGVFSYSRNVLERFTAAPEGNLEKIEKIEQLRCIENDIELHGVICVETPKSLDTSEDLVRYKNVAKKFYENPFTHLS